MDRDSLFIETLNDVRQKLEKGDEYNLIRCCGLLRHLLLDSLVRAVNKTRKIPILFKVAIHKNDTIYLPLWRNPLTSPPQKHEMLNMPKFLEWNIAQLGGYSYSISDVIKIASHVKGGIHSDDPKTKAAVFIDYERNNPLNRYRQDLIIIKSIAKISLEALAPLEIAISGHIQQIGDR